MISRLRKLVRLAPADWWELSLAYPYLLRAGWRLFVRREKVDRWVINPPMSPFPKGGLEEGGAKKTLTQEERRALARLARWVNAAAQYPRPWAKCLQRSLALCLWLEKQGFEPELKIGVRKKGDVLEAHAWVEYCGEVVNDRPYVSVMFVPMVGANVRLRRTWRD